MLYTQHVASGSILSDRYIVSNARPFTQSWNEPSNFRAVANIARTWDRSVDSYEIETFIVHPNFNADTGENDIAILRTASTILFHERVQPISLSQLILKDHQEAIFSGYGFVEENPITHVPLARVNFRVISNEDCKRIVGTENSGKVFDSKACVLSQDKRTICNYDNGAPLTIGNELVGMSSWSIPCRYDYPIIVERIRFGLHPTTYYLNYILYFWPCSINKINYSKQSRQSQI